MKEGKIYLPRGSVSQTVVSISSTCRYLGLTSRRTEVWERSGCLGICISNDHFQTTQRYASVTAAATEWPLWGVVSHLLLLL